MSTLIGNGNGKERNDGKRSKNGKNGKNVKPEMVLEMEKAIASFTKDPNQTQTSTPIINGQKYFIKVCGETRGKYKNNEVDALQCLSKISPFYRDYFIGSLDKDGKTAILLKYIDGTDMYEMIRGRAKWDMSFLVKLYKLLLSKIRVYHDHLLTHGDIKATNFYIHTQSVGDDTDIDLIDTESVNNFNLDHRIPGQKSKFINFISVNYDFPVKLKRGNIQFANHKNAFLFYKFLDLYAISVLILYMYKPKIYHMLKNKGDKDNVWKVGKRQHRPTDYIRDNKNHLERALNYVFSFLSYVEQSGTDIRIDNIPISHRHILEILDEDKQSFPIQQVDNPSVYISTTQASALGPRN